MQLLAPLLLLAASTATAQQCLTHPCPPPGASVTLVCIAGQCVPAGGGCPGCPCPGCGLPPPPPCFFAVLPIIGGFLCPPPPKPAPAIPGIVQIAKRHEKDFTMRGPVALTLEERDAEMAEYKKVMEEYEANMNLKNKE